MNRGSLWTLNAIAADLVKSCTVTKSLDDLAAVVGIGSNLR
jgi:hypothetical protein